MDDKIFYLLLGTFSTVILVCIVLLVGEFKKSFKTKEENDALIEEYFQNDGEIIEIYAEIVDMACGTKMIGVKSAKTVECYVVMFRDELGGVREIPVDHEMYDALEVGMYGTLKLVDGRLYSFEAKN